MKPAANFMTSVQPLFEPVCAPSKQIYLETWVWVASRLVEERPKVLLCTTEKRSRVPSLGQRRNDLAVSMAYVVCSRLGQH